MGFKSFFSLYTLSFGGHVRECLMKIKMFIEYQTYTDYRCIYVFFYLLTPKTNLVQSR